MEVTAGYVQLTGLLEEAVTPFPVERYLRAPAFRPPRGTRLEIRNLPASVEPGRRFVLAVVAADAAEADRVLVSAVDLLRREHESLGRVLEERRAKWLPLSAGCARGTLESCRLARSPEYADFDPDLPTVTIAPSRFFDETRQLVNLQPPRSTYVLVALLLALALGFLVYCVQQLRQGRPQPA